MTISQVTPPYILGPDDKVTPMMIYTLQNLFVGEAVTKTMVRISTWLRTNTAPERITLYNARVINILNATPPRPMQLTEVNISLSQVLAYHMSPPGKEPLDFDATEPNRKMEPTTMLVSSFRIDGNLRISTRSSVTKFLEVTRENFTSIYDAKITNILITSLSPIAVPFLMVRQETTLFARA